MEKVKLPKVCVLELTYRCNHYCKFCSCPWEDIDGSFVRGNELTTDEWFAAIDKLYDLGIESFSLSGGEAILRHDIVNIIEHIRQEGLHRKIDQPMVIISNGRSLTDDLLDVFAWNRVHLSMSLPGYNTFAWHTGVDNADGVLGWFKKAKAKGLHTTAGITVTKQNYSELYETIALALISGAEQILLNRFLVGGRGITNRWDLELSTDQIQGMFEIAEEVLKKAKRYGSVGTECPLCLIPHPNKYEYLTIGSKCAAASEFFVIGPSGEIRVCNHSPQVIGNIRNESIIEDTSYWNLFANHDYVPKECKSCKLVKSCVGGCREVAHITQGSPCALDSCVERINH